MPEDPCANLESVLQTALVEAESLKLRIESGADIGVGELEGIAKLIAAQMEQARVMLESVVGTVDHEALKANLKAKLSPEEYQDWLEVEERRLGAQNQSSLMAPQELA